MTSPTSSVDRCRNRRRPDTTSPSVASTRAPRRREVSRERKVGVIALAALSQANVGGSAVQVFRGAPGGFAPRDAIRTFCTASGVDQSAELSLRALPAHAQQMVMADGPAVGFNPSAILMARVRKAEQAMAGLALMAARSSPRPRPETVVAAAMGDPVAIFITQHAVDFSAENALRSLPVALQCRVLNEGPLRAANPSAVLMSRIHKAQLSAL